jgi:hypothetical protein
VRLNYDGVSLSSEFLKEHGLYRSYAWNNPLDDQNAAYRSTDRRSRQWNQDSAIVTEATKKANGNPADSDLTPSGYFKEGWDGMLDYVRRCAKDYMAKRERDRYRVFAGPNEYQYLFFGGDKWYADYGPYAQAEFRDWLTWRGEFAEGGRFAGKGRPGGEEFADDPSPARAKGRNKSFNATYGTRFTTWELKYWDLKRFSDPLPMDAKGMPGEDEQGYTEGGFDAPRSPGQPMWKAWQCNSEGSPGYRQWRIADALIEMLRVAVEECGVPREEVWTRQHGCRETGAAVNRRATTLAPWMNVTPYNNIGWNLYGVPRDPKVWANIQRMAKKANCQWGSYEFHPSPYDLYKLKEADYLQALRLFHQYGARYVRCVTWLGNNTGESRHGMAPGSMRIKDTPFEPAIKQFLTEVPDRPWGSDTDARWLVPAPHGLVWDAETGTVSWSDKMWEGEPFTYQQWAPFERFDLYTCESIDEDGDPTGLRRLDRIKRDEGCSVEIKTGRLKKLLIIRGVCDGRLDGPWSKPVPIN